VNQGIFHESLNMAQLWKLPIIYICENNQYGMGTSQERAMSTRNIAKKADAFEMANEFVDGMDVMAVRDATLRAIDRASAGDRGERSTVIRVPPPAMLRQCASSGSPSMRVVITSIVRLIAVARVMAARRLSVSNQPNARLRS